MFERFTEPARRLIFFAKYEAHCMGSPFVETEHLLLGLLREDKPLARKFLHSDTEVDSIREKIEASQTVREKNHTSDSPLAQQSKRVLAHAALEAQDCNQSVAPQHILLGLLHDKDCFAAELLREYGLLEHFKLNLETNHATLAGHTMHHECEVAAAAGALGTLYANTGDEMIGWDTDQFPTDIYLTTQCMLSILNAGGLTTGGVNFDAKVRRESFDPVDLFYAHIGGMDAFARGLKIASLARDSFSKLLATGLSFVIAMQVFVIVGGVTRVIPLTGVTLPLVAYGGSSVVMNFVLVALLLVISDRARRPYSEAEAPVPKRRRLRRRRRSYAASAGR